MGKQSSYHCPLGKAEGTPVDADALKRQGWRAQGILVINADDARLTSEQKYIIRQIGKLLYGERGTSTLESGNDVQTR